MCISQCTHTHTQTFKALQQLWEREAVFSREPPFSLRSGRLGWGAVGEGRGGVGWRTEKSRESTAERRKLRAVQRQLETGDWWRH